MSYLSLLERVERFNIHLISQLLAKVNHQRSITRLAFQHKYFKQFIIHEWPVDSLLQKAALRLVFEF